MPDHPLASPTVTAYGDGLRDAIAGFKSKMPIGKSLIVLIKPSAHSIYADLVNALDEVNEQQVPTYAIAAISPQDVGMLTQKGIY